jgi:hypothetical protein
MKFLEPWGPVGERAGDLQSELARELPAIGHVLSARDLVAVAARHDRDDVLFAVAGLGYAVVHLTWSGQQEPTPLWPRTRLFATLDDWCEREMRPNHAEDRALR